MIYLFCSHIENESTFHAPDYNDESEFLEILPRHKDITEDTKTLEHPSNKASEAMPSPLPQEDSPSKTWFSLVTLLSMTVCLGTSSLTMASPPMDHLQTAKANYQEILRMRKLVRQAHVSGESTRTQTEKQMELGRTLELAMKFQDKVRLLTLEAETAFEKAKRTKSRADQKSAEELISQAERTKKAATKWSEKSLELSSGLLKMVRTEYDRVPPEKILSHLEVPQDCLSLSEDPRLAMSELSQEMSELKENFDLFALFPGKNYEDSIKVSQETKNLANAVKKTEEEYQDYQLEVRRSLLFSKKIPQSLSPKCTALTSKARLLKIKMQAHTQELREKLSLLTKGTPAGMTKEIAKEAIQTDRKRKGAPETGSTSTPRSKPSGASSGVK